MTNIIWHSTKSTVLLSARVSIGYCNYNIVIAVILCRFYHFFFSLSPRLSRPRIAPNCIRPKRRIFPTYTVHEISNSQIYTYYYIIHLHNIVCRGLQKMNASGAPIEFNIDQTTAAAVGGNFLVELDLFPTYTYHSSTVHTRAHAHALIYITRAHDTNI